MDVIAGHIKLHLESIKGENLDPLDLKLLHTLLKSLNDDAKLLGEPSED
jgi:hypothetical protein